jgi:hypothetical protein
MRGVVLLGGSFPLYLSQKEAYMEKAMNRESKQRKKIRLLIKASLKIRANMIMNLNSDYDTTCSSGIGMEA